MTHNNAKGLQISPIFFGDASGLYSSNVATGIQNHHVQNATPTNGQCLMYVNANSEWEPTSYPPAPLFINGVIMTGTYTPASTDVFIQLNGHGLTLPASTSIGRVLFIFSTGVETVTAATGHTINGSSSITLSGRNHILFCINGSNWAMIPPT